MVQASQSVLEGTRAEPITISQADFEAGPANATTVDPQEVVQVARAEIGEEGSVFSAYDFARLGQRLDRTQNSAQGKIYMGNTSSDGSATDERTELRFVVMPKNQNHRTPLTQWFPTRDLDRDDPRLRYPLSPVTRNGQPAYVKEGRILAVEARNGSSQFDIDVTACDWEVPARARY